MLDLNLPAFENKKYTAYDRFHRNGPYGKISTKKNASSILLLLLLFLLLSLLLLLFLFLL